MEELQAPCAQCCAQDITLHPTTASPGNLCGLALGGQASTCGLGILLLGPHPGSALPLPVPTLSHSPWPPMLCLPFAVHRLRPGFPILGGRWHKTLSAWGTAELDPAALAPRGRG